MDLDPAIAPIYKAIASLDPKDRIDAQIITCITNEAIVNNEVDRKSRVVGLSAQSTRQEMSKILKRIH